MKVLRGNQKMRKTIYYYKVMIKSFKTQYIYKSQVLSKILYCIISYLIQMYIWESVNLASNVNIYNSEYMSGYVLISSVISVFIAFDMNYIPVIESKVRSGSIGNELTKPASFLLYNFFEYLGKCIFKMLFNAVPLCVFFLICGVKTRIVLNNIFPFMISLLLALSIFFLLSVILGMLSFWFMAIGNLHIIIDSSITLFSGSIIPLWLIPEKVKFLFELLPFKYLFYYPISIMLDLIEGCRIFDIYIGQLLWIVALLMVAYITYSFGIKKLHILG